MAETTRQKATFNLKEKPEFPATHDGMIVTSRTLGKHINALMSRIFADYSGCKIYVDQGSVGVDGMPIQMNPNHPVQLEMYFNLGNHVEGERRLYAFKPIVDKIKEAAGNTGRKSYIAQALGHNIAITQNKSSESTDDGMDILGDMLWYEVVGNMPKNPTAKDFNNKGIVVEACTASGNNLYAQQNNKVVYNVVRFVDINIILSKLFENNKKPYLYTTVPLKPILPTVGGYIVPNIGGTDQKWLFNVSRINQETLSDVCNDLGVYDTGNGLHVNTDGITR